MNKILFIISLTSLVYSSMVINQPMEQFNLKDQFDKSYKVTKNTKKIIFAFEKHSGHIVKNFLNTQKADYLSKRDILFIVDASAMPSFMKMFILPFTGYDYPILTIEDEEISKKYIDDKNSEKIMVVVLDDINIVDIKYFDDVKSLQNEIEGI